MELSPHKDCGGWRMSAMQRLKGAAAERELARLLTAELGAVVTRNLEQCRDGGASGDLLNIPGFSLEVKRAATPRLGAWWAQAVGQAEKCGRIPALAYRLDRRDWRFLLPLSALADDLNTQPPLLGLAAELSIEGFCLVVRERLNPRLSPTPPGPSGLARDYTPPPAGAGDL